MADDNRYVYVSNEDERVNIAKVYASGDPDTVLESAEAMMGDISLSSDRRMIAELAYIQIGMICPLANEFIEAAGLGGNQ
jgi:hypothetical protein